MGCREAQSIIVTRRQADGIETSSRRCLQPLFGVFDNEYLLSLNAGVLNGLQKDIGFRLFTQELIGFQNDFAAVKGASELLNDKSVFCGRAVARYQPGNIQRCSGSQNGPNLRKWFASPDRMSVL